MAHFIYTGTEAPTQGHTGGTQAQTYWVLNLNYDLLGKVFLTWSLNQLPPASYISSPPTPLPGLYIL